MNNKIIHIIIILCLIFMFFIIRENELFTINKRDTNYSIK